MKLLGADGLTLQPKYKRYIYKQFLKEMPQLANDKEITIARDTNSRALNTLLHLRNLEQAEERYSTLPAAIQAVDTIDPNHLEDPDFIIENYLYATLYAVAQEHKDDSKGKVMEAFATSIIKKIVEIFGTRTKKTDSLSYITKLLNNKKILLFYKFTAKTSILSSYYPRDKDAEPNRFHQETVGTVLQQLLKYQKIVWDVQPKEFIDFIIFLNGLQFAPLHSKEAKDIIEALAAQLLAYFRSGRPELSRYCGSVSSMRSLDEALLKKVSDQSMVRYISEIGPTLAVLYLKSPQEERRKMGLTLMEHYIDEYSYNRFNKMREQDWKAWVRSQEIFEYVLADVRFCEEMVEKHKNFFGCLRRYKTHEQRMKLIVTMLKQDITGCDRLAVYIRKELDYYYLDIRAKEVLLEYFATVTNYSSVPNFFEILPQLLIRSESDSFLEKAYAVILRIMLQDYEKLAEAQRTKCLSAFKTILANYLTVLKKKSAEARQRLLKESITELFTNISAAKIVIFNLTIIENETWKAYSNTNFQTMLTDLVEKTRFFDNVFKYLEEGVGGRVSEKDFVKIIKFVSAKTMAKQDATFRYIHIISKFPEVFQELIESSGYAQIEEQMRRVIELFRSSPSTPFHILTLTFERINHSSFADYRKVPSLLHERKEQKELIRTPKSLKYYQALTDLLLETESASLRQQLCNYILSLFWNFKQCKTYSYEGGEETFITFLVQLLDNFEKDWLQFANNPSLAKALLVDLEFLEKALQFTDILGCGVFKPHKSLVSTSTMLLSVINNVTFGDDVAKTVHRDFPSSMTLFDALTILGMQFKCGPESIVLKQAGRFISPIFNCCSLEDLGLTNEEIIAQQNNANTLQPPQLLEEKSADYRAPVALRAEVIKVITDVFNRFAYEGKMSLIECTNFVRQASGSECISSDRRVKEVFEYDTDNDGIVTLPQFIQYYKKNLSGASYYKEQMLKGLCNLRYRKNLTLFNEPLDISSQHYLMMRFKIVKNYPHFYEILFRLATHHQPALSVKAKKLLLFLPSSPKMKTEATKPLNFQDNTEFEIYYKLISTENMLSGMEGGTKAAKIEEFLKNKNDEVIFRLLSQYHAKAGRNDFEARSLLICLRILRSLINIQQLSTGNIYNYKLESLSIPHLPSTTFFAQHTAVALQSRNIINFETLLVLQLTQEQVELQPIITCCFNNEQNIRRIACHFLYLWSLKTRFALDLFKLQIGEKYNEQWFELLCGVIHENATLDLSRLKENALDLLEKREESFQNQYDPFMNGYLKILAAIAQKQRLTSDKLEQIFTHLLNSTISQKNRALVFQLIRREKREIGYGYFDRMLSTILPSQECLIRQKYVGIKNLGAICYINSILQQFFMIDQFKHMVLSKPIPHQIQPVEVNGRPVIDDFMFQLQKLYHQLQYGKKKYVVPRDFCYAYKNFEGQPINTSIQEDAHEFLNRLIETAEEAFKKEGRLAQLQELLMIKKLSEIECQVCKNRIDKYEQDYCLMIEVKNHDTLVDSLRKFTEREEIADYFCEKCNRKMPRIFKRTYLNALPQIVILNLQRIVYDQYKGDKVKVHTQLSFPQSISFADFVKNDGPAPPTDYKLKGVVIHTGTSEGGHYYSLVKTKKQGWLKFNDQTVSAFDEKDLERETFGGFEGRDGWGDVNYSTNAYILFYERANVNSKEFIQAENEFTEEMEKENTRLINELQIHQQSFFKAILTSYESIRPTNLDELVKVHPFIEAKPDPNREQEYLQLIRIGHKAFSFLSVYTEIKQEIRGRMGSMLMEIYFMLPEETTKFLKDCNINTYFENMISDSSHGEREILKQTFLSILVIHIRYYGINLTVDNQQNHLICDILDKALSYMQSKLFYSNITKTAAYLSFWELLARSEESVCQILIMKGYFFRLLDLLMGKESPFMKQHPIAQDIPVNLAAIVFNSIDKLLEWKLSMKGRKVFSHSCFPTSSLQASILTNHNFYRRIMRLKYSHPSLSNLITHYSIHDLQFSAVIAQFLISSINIHEQITDLPLFFKHVFDFLVIKDQLQAIRCGWILGISQNKECSMREDEYCLPYSDRSEVIHYISGINYKKAMHLDSRRPLMELAYEKKSTEKQFVFFIIKLILELAVESQTVLQFILSMPPPNYLMRTYFDWMPESLSIITKDTQIFIDRKTQNLEQLKNIMEIVKDKIKMATGLPAQNYIIGKKKKLEVLGRSIDKDYQLSLRRLTTYVLDNKPMGEENESMPRKYFSSQNPSGIGHFFVYYRSKSGFESEAKDVKIAETLYILSGKTQVRLRLVFKGKLFRHHIITGEGEISIVFPFEKAGEIDDFVDILPYSEQRVEALPAEVQQVFGAQQKKEDAMEEEKMDLNPAIPDGAFQQPKIKCGVCTFDNQLTRDHCEMCDSALFN